MFQCNAFLLLFSLRLYAVIHSPPIYTAVTSSYNFQNFYFRYFRIIPNAKINIHLQSISNGNEA